MTTKQLTRITMMACILAVVFEVFANILYLEMITFTIMSFALVFLRKEVVFATAIFAILHMLMNGITPWTIGYLLMYPGFAFIFASVSPWLRKHPILIPISCGICSFLGGQLMDLPFILFSTKITIFYIITGLKTSLIQGLVTYLAALFLWEPIMKALLKIKERELR